MKLKVNWQMHIRPIYLVGAIALFGVGGTVAYIGNLEGNPLLIALGFGGLVGGFLLFLAWLRRSDIRHIRGGKEERGKDYKPPNSLNLYPDRIEFIYEEAPKGQSQKYLNDGKYYHVHEVPEEEIKEFRLPDDDEKERYYDPGEFANPVTMPSNKRYFTWSASTMQKISVGIMGIIIAAEIIGLVAMGG